MRMVTMRGKKASVYEGGHRVPFLSWWPLGTHKALHGTNFDLPVGQVDFFATFADIMNYPLPGKEACKYAKDGDDATIGRLKRSPGRSPGQYENSFRWSKMIKEKSDAGLIKNPCTAYIGVKQRATRECDWVTCDQCNAFWDEHVGTPMIDPFGEPLLHKHGAQKGEPMVRTQEWMNIFKRVFCESKKGIACVDTNSGYTMTVQMAQEQYLKESLRFGYSETELFKTKETKTGFQLGWEGCMAEDSQSFAAAYQVADENPESKFDNGKEYKVFEPKLKHVPSKIFAGKLGDLNIRLGRYKLVRFNAPKDYRTGPTRQHLNDYTHHEGDDWMNASWGERCSYDEEGNLLPGHENCTVEPLCRNTTTFGRTTCMRDHFYQLWDLEKNFGEKTFCKHHYDSKTSKFNANLELENALGLSFARAFDMGAEGTKAPEKPSDKWGYGLGIESTPVGEWTNDCCVLNYDERPAPPPHPDMCKSLRIKKGRGHNGFNTDGTINDDDRTEVDGGICKFMRYLRKGNFLNHDS